MKPMSQFQIGILVLLTIALGYTIFRVETIMITVNHATVMADRVMSNMDRIETLVQSSHAAIAEAGTTGGKLIDKAKELKGMKVTVERNPTDN